MELTFDEIRTLTHGADHFTEEKDGLHFHKCTALQENAWKAINPEKFYRRSLQTCGVRLEMETDADSISFEAPAGNKYEIWVNGVFFKQIRMNELRERGEKPVIELEPGDKSILFALPSHSHGVLSSFCLNGATYFRPVSRERKILFIGDSITQGWDGQYDTLSFAYRTATALGADFHINGIGGARYVPETFDRISSFEPDTVVIAYGTNDFGQAERTVEENRANAAGYLDRVRAAYGDRRVVVLTPIWRADKDEEWHRTVRTCIAKEAAERGFEVVDGELLFPRNTAFFADGFLHPNDLGFSVIAERLTAYLSGRI